MSTFNFKGDIRGNNNQFGDNNHIVNHLYSPPEKLIYDAYYLDRDDFIEVTENNKKFPDHECYIKFDVIKEFEDGTMLVKVLTRNNYTSEFQYINKQTRYSSAINKDLERKEDGAFTLDKRTFMKIVGTRMNSQDIMEFKLKPWSPNLVSTSESPQKQPNVTREDLIQVLKEDEFEYIFKTLSQIFEKKNRKLNDEIILLELRHTDLQKEIRQGTLSSQEVRIERTTIRNTILLYINEAFPQS